MKCSKRRPRRQPYLDNNATPYVQLQTGALGTDDPLRYSGRPADSTGPCPMSDLSCPADPPLNPHFAPPRLLRPADIQNLASSLGLRSRMLKRRGASLWRRTRREILDCGDGVRLAGDLSLREDADSLVVLFHGWEGSSESAYVLSAALALYEAGHSVFRLNFRDHGDTHHLNRELFNSTLLPEVLAAVRTVQSRWPHRRNFLAGYSLGGNFALRAALAAPEAGIVLDQVAAICPVIDPAQTLAALERARFFYQAYFVRKWQRSLLKKLDHFPDYGYRDELRGLKTLRAMHDFFVPRFTPFAHRDDYFRAYAVPEQQLGTLAVPALIINSKDDPITRHHLLPVQNLSPRLQIEVTEHGSHCAFLRDFRLNSWADDRLVQLFQ